MSGRLSGKVALVTGTGAGIGKAIGLRFAHEGATVIGCDIDAAAAQRTVAEAQREGMAIDSIHPVDLTVPADVRRVVEHVARTCGRIDVLVNAAAIAPHMAPTAQMDYERQWLPTLRGEADIVFLMCQAAWPYLQTGGRSAIVNFASVVSVRASQEMGMIAHCAGKAAVMAMTRQMAVEGGPGIRVNSIAPGLVMTPATKSAGASEAGPIRDAILRRIPAGRLGIPEDIASAAVFLASDEASWVTGVMLPVDGGTTAC